MFVVEVATFLVCGMIGLFNPDTLLGATKVEMFIKHSSSYISLTCIAQETDPINFMIHLYCPFISNRICYSNCNPICSFQSNKKGCIPNPKIAMISSCSLNKSQVNQISTTYQIDTTLINQTGDWMCKYKSYKSNSASLAKYEDPPTTKHSTTLFTRKFPTKTKTNSEKYIQEKISTPESSKTYELSFTDVSKLNKQTELITETRKQTRLPTEKSNETSNWVVQHLTRPELVLALVVMLGFSLLLNLSFLIRCVLLKSVVDNYHRGIPNSSCILGCLCIDQYAQQKRNSRSLNFSNQVGTDFYRCQPMSPDNLAIYDDLSAISNSSARVKLRSNHSTDVDEETMLTNLMSNGSGHINSIGVGSVSTSLPRRYTSPSHAAYFHPSLGNYVIVSGPITSQDQYTIGAAPPGYALQMVSPIPSAPGSIVGGPGTNMSVQSGHSDDLFDSDHSQTTNSMSKQSGKINNHPLDLIDSNKIFDISQNMNVHVNGFNSNRQILINNQNNIIRSNGSVPLHPWSVDKVPPLPSSSVTSLPQYSVSENGTYIQDKHEMKDPLLTNSFSNTTTEATS